MLLLRCWHAWIVVLWQYRLSGTCFAWVKAVASPIKHLPIVGLKPEQALVRASYIYVYTHWQPYDMYM